MVRLKVDKKKVKDIVKAMIRDKCAVDLYKKVVEEKYLDLRNIDKGELRYYLDLFATDFQHELEKFGRYKNKKEEILLKFFPEYIKDKNVNEREAEFIYNMAFINEKALEKSLVNLFRDEMEEKIFGDGTQTFIAIMKKYCSCPPFNYPSDWIAGFHIKTKERIEDDIDDIREYLNKYGYDGDSFFCCHNYLAGNTSVIRFCILHADTWRKEITNWLNDYTVFLLYYHFQKFFFPDFHKSFPKPVEQGPEEDDNNMLFDPEEKFKPEEDDDDDIPF